MSLMFFTGKSHADLNPGLYLESEIYTDENSTLLKSQTFPLLKELCTFNELKVQSYH